MQSPHHRKSCFSKYQISDSMRLIGDDSSVIECDWLWYKVNISLKSYKLLCRALYMNLISHLILSCLLLAFGGASYCIVLGITWFQHPQKTSYGENRPAMPMENALVERIAQCLSIVDDLDLGREWRLMRNGAVSSWNLNDIIRGI